MSGTANELIISPRKSNAKNCIRGHVALGQKRLFLRITQQSLCFVEALRLQCPDTCNAQAHKQCLVETDMVPKCVCLPGYQKDDSGICQE